MNPRGGLSPTFVLGPGGVAFLSTCIHSKSGRDSPLASLDDLSCKHLPTAYCLLDSTFLSEKYSP